MFDVDGSAVALAGRLLLDGAGLLFGLYVIALAGLWSGCRLVPRRPSEQTSPTGSGDVAAAVSSDR